MIRRRPALTGLAIVLLTIVSGGVIASPAYAWNPPVFSGHVYNGASTRCLDSGVPANAQLWPCSSSLYQQWNYIQRPYFRTIQGNSPSGCLDDGAGLNGSGVYLTACNGGLHQKWDYDGYHLANVASGRCLDADWPTIGQNGTKVQVWDCNGGANQVWGFEFES